MNGCVRSSFINSNRYALHTYEVLRALFLELKYAYQRPRDLVEDHVLIQQVWAGALLTDTPRDLALGPHLSSQALSAVLKAGTQQ